MLPHNLTFPAYKNLAVLFPIKSPIPGAMMTAQNDEKGLSALSSPPTRPESEYLFNDDTQANTSFGAKTASICSWGNAWSFGQGVFT